jgi:DNA replication protein
MDKFNINYLDYRSLLIDNYKSLGLNEYDLAILLLVDNILKEQVTLVTSDMLALKMNLDVKQIDASLASLLTRGFLEYVSNENSITTSIKPTYKRLKDNFIKELVINNSLEDNKSKMDELTNIFGTFEKELGRSLTPIEIEKIREWVSQDVKEDLIIDALHECQNKSKRVTLKGVDKIIIKRLTMNDIEKEGYSSISESNKNDLQKTIDIAATRWTDD